MLFIKESRKVKIDKNKKTIIFDFDGTVADTFEHLLDLLDQYSGDFGVELADKNILEELRAMSAIDIFKKFKIPFFMIPFINKKLQKGIGKRINEVYPFGDVIEAINKLKKQYNIGLLTTNSKQNVDRFLKKEDLTKLFDFIFTSNNVFGKHIILKSFLYDNNLTNTDIIYIGDEARDVEAARKANVKVISVGWGFNSEKILKKINKEYYVEDTKEMINKIKELL